MIYTPSPALPNVVLPPDMTLGTPSVNEILQGKLYLGNLSAAQSSETLRKFGMTHILSVCPDYPSTGPNHLTIAIHDSEYDNILIHLPKACNFIEAALKDDGKVLVHCVMGISRSATVVGAYLMKTRKISRSVAIEFIKQRRPKVHPNYGFIKQLEAFAECQYDPSPSNSVYCRWKRQQRRDVTQFLNHLVDTTTILPDELLLSSEFPGDVCQAESLVLDAGITHILSISPTKIPSPALTSLQKYQHINLTNRKDELLLALRSACLFIKEAIESGGQVLVHSLVETTACIVVCAFLMFANGLSDKEALAKIQKALPLFNPTKTFFCHLELFQKCQYKPMMKNPLVLDWGMSLTPAPKSTLKSDIRSIAAEIMSETGFDMSSFGKALAVIQHRVEVD